MKTKSLSVLLASILIGAFAASAQYNKKFTDNASKEVWSMKLPAFDATIDIPDSIAENQSAVIIAKLVYLDGDLMAEEAAATKSLGIKYDVLMTKTRRKIIKREMIKLLDAAAVEKYSEVEIPSNRNGGPDDLVTRNSAVGIRVFKPNGTASVVDVSKAFKVTSGKKGKKEEMLKLAVPDLEIGDVIDYFTYDMIDVLELPTNSVIFDILGRYPIISYELIGSFDKGLTVEYHPINGAPVLATGLGDDGNMKCGIQLHNLPGVPTNKWIASGRQLPKYRFAINNNATTKIWRPSNSRPPGMYPDLTSAMIYVDIAETMRKVQPTAELVRKTVNYMKDWIKANPGTPDRALIDRAWVAMTYFFLTDKKFNDNDMELALAFADIVKKLKLNKQRVGVGFVNSRVVAPAESALNYADVDYVAVVGDTLYQSADFFNCVPGEFPGVYHGERGAAFYENLFNKGEKLVPELIEVPVTKFNSNAFTTGINITIDPEQENLPMIFDRTVRNTGGLKASSPYVFHICDWAAEVEDYLGIPEKDRYKISEADEAEIKDSRDEDLKDEAEACLGVRPSKVTMAEHSSLGCTPAMKSMNYKMSGEIEGLVTEIGDDELIVNIGRLFGRNSKIEGRERRRDIDAIMEEPHQYTYNLVFTLPEGYTVDPQSVDALAKNISNGTGCFVVNPTLSDDGREINIVVIERYAMYVVPVTAWDQLLEILDAAAAFNETSIVITKQ